MFDVNKLPTKITVDTRIPEIPEQPVYPDKHDHSTKVSELEEQIKSNMKKCDEIRKKRFEAEAQQANEYDYLTREHKSITTRLAEIQKGKKMFEHKFDSDSLNDVNNKISILQSEASDIQQKISQYNQEAQKQKSSGICLEGFKSSKFNMEINMYNDERLQLQKQKQDLENGFVVKVKEYQNAKDYVTRIESIRSEKETLIAQIQTEKAQVDRLREIKATKVQKDKDDLKQQWVVYNEKKVIKDKILKEKEDEYKEYERLKQVDIQTRKEQQSREQEDADYKAFMGKVDRTAMIQDDKNGRKLLDTVKVSRTSKYPINTYDCSGNPKLLHSYAMQHPGSTARVSAVKNQKQLKNDTQQNGIGGDNLTQDSREAKDIRSKLGNA